jgi:tripartite-type tricarboxylate transporter receptor subunit TctC
VRALAVTGDKRLAGLPEVPTFKEVGLPSYTVTNWFGLAAPKGTPKEIVDKLQAEVAKALTDAKVKERFAAMGASPGGIAPADFAAFIRSETRVWSDISKTAGVKPD